MISNCMNFVWRFTKFIKQILTNNMRLQNFDSCFCLDCFSSIRKRHIWKDKKITSFPGYLESSLLPTLPALPLTYPSSISSHLKISDPSIFEVKLPRHQIKQLFVCRVYHIMKQVGKKEEKLKFFSLA